MALYCDLHTHSTFSDGTNTPTELIRLAEEANLAAVALTDHNTVEGLPEFLSAAKDSSVEAVCGIEISVDHKKTELHLIGMFLQPRHFEPIRRLLADGNRMKEESNRLLAQALNRGGYRVDYEALCQSTSGQVNRAHFAAALTKAGYTASVQEAFDTILHEDAGFYQAPPRPDAGDVITFLRTLGIVPVLAHPMIDLTEEALVQFLHVSVPRGLMAMETRYPLYSEAVTRRAQALAAQFGILECGGSDYHGATKPDIRIGVGKRNIRIPTQILADLKKGAEG